MREIPNGLVFNAQIEGIGPKQRVVEEGNACIQHAKSCRKPNHGFVGRRHTGLSEHHPCESNIHCGEKKLIFRPNYGGIP